MSENVEKIYCCDKGDNSMATAAMLNGMNNNANNWLPAMMANGGMGNQWNNPLN
jgi:hypothetical protein